MAERNLLAKSQLEKFKAWLKAKGHEWREGRGTYQVIQVQLMGEASWHVVYYTIKNQEHYSIPWPLVSTVEQFIAEKNGKNSHGNHHPSPRQQACAQGTQARSATGEEDDPEGSCPF